MEFDICVVGGGPAGLASAIAARRHGFSVLVVDRARLPIDKACGEGLMPDGVAALRGLGVQVGSATGMPFRGIRFLDGGLAAEASFPEGCGLGIRRLDLHRLLRERAEDVGVVMRWGSPADSAGARTVAVGGETVHCRWLIGADGMQSRVRQWAGLSPNWIGHRRIGIRQHFRLPPWSDFVEVYWRQGAQAYVTPVAPDEVCVAVLADPRNTRLCEQVALFPDLAQRLRNARRIGPVRGALSMSARLPLVTSSHFALVGDASGTVDAVTGEGITMALRHATALGDALAIGNLDFYETAHLRMRPMPLLAARLLLSFGAHERLRQRLLQTLAAYPQAFDALLAVHVGAGGTASGAMALATLVLRSLLPGSSTRGGREMPSVRSMPDTERNVASQEPIALRRTVP
jgi:menaquinone-9 beta-reductase